MPKKILAMVLFMLSIAAVSFADPTAEDILQKVADNYGKIEDMSAVITSSGTVKTPQHPAGEPSPDETGKFYIKKPNKMKVVYTHEILMSDGQTMYSLMDGKLVGSVDLTQANTSKLNFYFELNEFKQGHTFTLKGSKTQGTDTVYILECIPKPETKAMYEKLMLEINYEKGLDIKKEMYIKTTDTAPQTTEEAMTWQLLDTVWVITEVYEKNIILDGVVESWSRYSDIKLNTGISDTEFKP